MAAARSGAGAGRDELWFVRPSRWHSTAKNFEFPWHGNMAQKVSV